MWTTFGPSKATDTGRTKWLYSREVETWIWNWKMFKCCLGMNKFWGSRIKYRPKIEGLTQAYKIAGKNKLGTPRVRRSKSGWTTDTVTYALHWVWRCSVTLRNSKCKTSTIQAIQKASSIKMSQNAHQVWHQNTCSLCSSCLLSFWTFSLLGPFPPLKVS